MNIYYGVLSQGQGHINRSAEVIRRLRARGHRVGVGLVGNRPPAYARAVLGDVDFHEVPMFVLRDGRVDVAASTRRLLSSIPRGVGIARALARRCAAERVDLLMTDFEPTTLWAAALARVPVVGVSGQYRITHTDLPGPTQQRRLGRFTVGLMGLGLAQCHAVTFSPARATRARTRVVDPIVDERLRALPVRDGGFFLAYLYSYPRARVVEVLRGRTPFRVYGLDEEGSDGNVTFCRTDRAAFVADLAACAGVVLNGSFQGVCEAVVLGKPLLTIPFSGQYEETYNAFHVERSDLGLAAAALDRDAIARFVAYAARSRPRRTVGDGAAQVLDALGL